jgi:DNA-binding transcriptional LysR family regulator
MEEQSITRAAQRMHLTQSAMSRMVDRLQILLQDPLFIRVAKGYKPTHRALSVYRELEHVLPRVEAILHGPGTNSAEFNDTIRIEASDSTAVIILPRLLENVQRTAPRIRIDLVPRSRNFKALETNDVDLVLGHDIDTKLQAPTPTKLIRQETLFSDKLVCLVRKNHPLTRSLLTLKRYLDAHHLAIWAQGYTERVGNSLANERQKLIAQWLDESNKHRDVRMRVPYGLIVGEIVANTDLVATVLSRIALRLKNSRTRIISAPVELRGIVTHCQFWHPRDDMRPTHIWLRRAIQNIAQHEQQTATKMHNPSTKDGPASLCSC